MTRTATSASKRAARRRTVLRRNARHHADPVQHDPAPGEGRRPRRLTGVERIGAGEESAYAVRAGGRKCSPGAKTAKASSATAKTAKRLPGQSELRTALAGGRNRGRLTARARAAGERPGVRVGRRRPRASSASKPAAKPSESCGQQKCSMIPQPVGDSTTWWPSRPARRHQPRAQRRRRRQQGDLLVRGQRLLRTARARQPAVTSTSTPTPIKASPRCAACRASGTTAVALLQSGSAASPRSPLSPSEGSLTVDLERARRTVQTALRAGGHARIQQKPGKQLQRRMQRAVHGAETRALRSDPEKPRRQRRPRKDPAHHRHAGGRRNRWPGEHLSAHDQRQTGDRNEETAPRPDADRRARRLVQRTHRSPTSGCAARATAKPAPAKNSAANANRSRPAKAPRPAKPTKSRHRTSRARSRSKWKPKTPPARAWRCPKPELVLAEGEESEPPFPTLDRTADAQRHGRRRAHPDRAPRLLGKLADGARRQVVPLQRAQPKKASAPPAGRSR